jgi:hypothetical protein
MYEAFWGNNQNKLWKQPCCMLHQNYYRLQNYNRDSKGKKNNVDETIKYKENETKRT